MICFFPVLHVFSIPLLIGFRYAVWLIDVICVDLVVGSSSPQTDQNAAQDQPKTARKRPKRRQEGPKRAPRRAQKGPKTGPRRPMRASGRPKRQHLRVGRQPRPSCSENRAGSGLFWGPFWGPSWAPNRPKLAPERVQKRRPNLHAEKYRRRARKSGTRGVRATPGEAKIVKNLCVLRCF